MGCASSKRSKQLHGYEDPSVLAAETPFTASEVESLEELYKKLSNSIIADGLIHKEEFHLALFKNRNQRNLFADRVFDLFDLKRNGVIEFGEFVRSLGIFHPNAPVADKIACKGNLFDGKSIIEALVLGIELHFALYVKSKSKLILLLKISSISIIKIGPCTSK
ncbi:hypothetical protein E1A91_A11G016000v1 [Gossypium mustelinum]|uniref:Calcineurin B-like protein n=1 Tax=Gossypium mustelinum TaxID=34275 RepID=A0A5D2X162_GOSMU|nr:hypothetical protein E1A91_A11G016000v1 [Gossypium mustelinum]